MNLYRPWPQLLFRQGSRAQLECVCVCQTPRQIPSKHSSAQQFNLFGGHVAFQFSKPNYAKLPFRGELKSTFFKRGDKCWSFLAGKSLNKESFVIAPCCSALRVTVAARECECEKREEEGRERASEGASERARERASERE